MEYADRGQGDPILAVHGTLGGCDQGLVATEFFRANGFRIIAPSRPGYLGTPLSTGSSPAEQADALAALLDEIGVNETAVFGGSGGGPAAYALAARHPEKVSRLLQVDSISQAVPPVPFARLGARDPAIKAQLWFLRHAAAPMLKMLFQRFGRMPGARAADLAAAVAADPIRMAHLEAILRASSGWAGRREGLDNDLVTLGLLAPLDLESITCPTLIMHASKDATVPPENARNAHERITGSELYWMEGSHLSFFLEEGDTAPGHALEWLRGNNPAGRTTGPGP